MSHYCCISKMSPKIAVRVLTSHVNIRIFIDSNLNSFLIESNRYFCGHVIYSRIEFLLACAKIISVPIFGLRF